MPKQDYDFQQNEQQNINTKTWQDSDVSTSDSDDTVQTNKNQDYTENIPKLTEEEQAAQNEKRNSPEFQQGLQNMLPKNDKSDSDQANKEKPANLNALIQQWQKDTPKAGIEEVNPTNIPDKIKASIENYSGISLNDVQVHYNSSEPAKINALAYAQGNNVYLAPGQEKHLAHELAHIIQQKKGKVQANAEVNGMQVNDEESLETQADKMGAKATMLDNTDTPNKQKRKVNTPSNEIIQPMWAESKTENIQIWDELIDGTTWYFDSTSQLMWFEITQPGTKDYTEFQGQKKSYLDWIAIYNKFEKIPYSAVQKEDHQKESDGSDEQNAQIITGLIPEAQSYGKYLATQQGSAEGMATLLLNYTDVLADKARKKMEGVGTGIKNAGLPSIIIKKITAALTELKATNDPALHKVTLSKLSGFMVANQVFSEGNNRANYFLLVMLSEIFNTPIPPASAILSRKKIGFFEKNVTAQFLDMFNQMGGL